MLYRKALLLNVCLCLCALLSAQQYPFVHYTPKDGLISNRVRSIYQDSKGRLYFCTQNGLSVYDGARFTNYTTEDGLHNDIVNCVMEMGDDSVWVITNTNKINYLVKGELKTLALGDSTVPVINLLCRNTAGELYAAADDGLFLFDKNSFVRVPFTDVQGTSINSYITSLVPYGRYLLVMRDYGLVTDAPKSLYLYDCTHRKTISQTSGSAIVSTGRSPSGLVWISTNKQLLQLDTAALKKGEIIPGPLPAIYKNFAANSGYIFFDATNDCWLTDGVKLLKRCDANGQVTAYTTASRLNTVSIGYIFQDREGTIWLASNGGGIEKLMYKNLSFIEKPFGFLSASYLISAGSSGEMLLYSAQEKKIARFAENQPAEIISINSTEELGLLASAGKNLYGIQSKKIFRLNQRGTIAYADFLYADTSGNNFGTPVADKNGNLIVSGSFYLTAVTATAISHVPINYLADQIAIDNAGKIWVATRAEQLFQFSAHPENPAAYLKQEMLFEKELQGIQPRSITVDNSGKIWIGTRYNGLYVFQQEKQKLNLLYHLTSKTGLTENFILHLSCDEENNIWVCSASGLDKIHLQNKEPVVENITRQNNMYQLIYQAVTDKNKATWALSSGGIIKITSEKRIASGYIPRLIMTQVRNGTTLLQDSSGISLTHKQNNLSFYFAAPSFLDEKQIQYSYRLQGSATTEWSEPSGNAFASFIGLHPGNYTLHIKAVFPAGRYPDQTLQYKFSIAPPWWQTWWFRILAALLIAGLLTVVVRNYYRIKLEKQRIFLEKQQAVEKERTRIATDMHDDLGAGLSRIKFLSETIGIKQQQQQPIEEEIIRIREYSHEMIDKMGEIVWALNEKNDSLSDLLSYTRSYSVDYLSQNGIVCKVNMQENFPDMFVSGEFRRNIYLAVKEALHNIVKHAQADNTVISILVHRELIIAIKDDGVGFDNSNTRNFSNGISNMKKRMADIGGSFSITPGNGTEINLKAPLG
jgi:signal transduction histidine kinase/ligand-binding sensor domain-containing protein